MASAPAGLTPECFSGLARASLCDLRDRCPLVYKMREVARLEVAGWAGSCPPVGGSGEWPECAFCGVAVGGHAGPARGLRRRRAGVLGDGLVPSVHVRSAPVPLALFLPLGLTSALARAPVAFAPSQARVGGGGPCVCDEPHVHVCVREQTVRGPACALLPCLRHVCPSCLSASVLDGCGGPRLAHSQALARIRADRCEEGGFTRSWASEGQGLTREDRGAAWGVGPAAVGQMLRAGRGRSGAGVLGGAGTVSAWGRWGVVCSQ